MNGERLLKERLSRNWEQQEAATKLKVSQPYLSLIEAGKRPVTEKLARRAVSVFKLPPTALPIRDDAKNGASKSNDLLASQLARLGYPMFSHLKKSKKINPAAVLTFALREDDVDSRVVEALPWLIFSFSDLDWGRVIEAAKLSNAQNRLGFLLSLALDLAKQKKDEEKSAVFKRLLSALDESRLVRNDSFNRKTLTGTETKWLIKNRPKRARYWRIYQSKSGLRKTDRAEITGQKRF